MIDIHAHILPCVDHGSASGQMSAKLLETAKNAGVETIVATPHFYLSHGDTVESFLAKRQRGVDDLSDAMQRARLDCEIIPAAEVTLRLGISALDLSALCISGTNTMLLEMPVTDRWPEWVFNEVAQILSDHDIRLLIAHIDRYNEREVRRLFSCFDLMGQINASSVTSFFSRRKVKRYLDDGIVFAIGSDVHRSAGAYEDLGKCRKLLGDAEMAHIEARSRRIISKR